jgi:hypothetical protein
MNAVQVSTHYESFVDGSKPISASVKCPNVVVGKLFMAFWFIPQCVSLAILHQVFHGHTHRDQSLVAMCCYHINQPRTAEIEHREVLSRKHRTKRFGNLNGHESMSTAATRGCTKKEVSPRHHTSSGTSVARTNEAEPRNYPR